MEDSLKEIEEKIKKRAELKKLKRQNKLESIKKYLCPIKKHTINHTSTICVCITIILCTVAICNYLSCIEKNTEQLWSIKSELS